ncbi:hypothetical protein P3T35_001505 [Kitasatospora sp. GP30]|nr:hypothetical protein [Kitasatospora sp. GP30]
MSGAGFWGFSLIEAAKLIVNVLTDTTCWPRYEYDGPSGASPRLRLEDRLSTCTIDECERPAMARNMCSMHWQRWRRHGSAADLTQKRSRWGSSVFPDDQHKRCPSCEEVKPLSEYGVCAGRSRGVAAKCRPCAAAYSKKHRADNPDYASRNSIRQKQRWLERQYGLTQQEFENLLASQAGVCAICRELPDAGSRLHVDHDHSCCPGKISCGACVRGLLCARCNRLLGQARDDAHVLLAAANYLTGEGTATRQAAASRQRPRQGTSKSLSNQQTGASSKAT